MVDEPIPDILLTDGGEISSYAPGTTNRDGVDADGSGFDVVGD